MDAFITRQIQSNPPCAPAPLLPRAFPNFFDNLDPISSLGLVVTPRAAAWLTSGLWPKVLSGGPAGGAAAACRGRQGGSKLVAPKTVRPAACRP